MSAPEPDTGGPSERLSLRVQQIRFEAVGVNSYELVDPEGRDLPLVDAGSHVDVHLDSGVVRQYSLCNDPGDRRRYLIAVLRDDQGRGGSRTLHETLRVAQRVTIGLPRNNFPLAGDARRHLLVAGGIGITPLKAMIHSLVQSGATYELHYCAKDADHAAFREELTRLGRGERVTFHFDGGVPTNGLDIATLLAMRPAGTHLYYCGPPGFMAACAAASAHWPSDAVHSEHFKAPTESHGLDVGGHDPEAFAIEIAGTGERLWVSAERTIVEVLRVAGFAVPTSCEAGLCGTCKVGYLSGEVDHRDMVLSEDERANCLTTCVSRAKSGVLVLDL